MGNQQGELLVVNKVDNLNKVEERSNSLLVVALAQL